MALNRNRLFCELNGVKDYMCSFVHISVANYAYNFNYRMGTICVVDVHVVFLFVGGSKFMFIRYTRGTGTPFLD